MKHSISIAFIVLCSLAHCRADEAPKSGVKSLGTAAESRNDFVVLPNSASPVQFRLYTNAAPDSPHLFNTFDLKAYGERLLQSPGGDPLKRALGVPSSDGSLHSVLVNGHGPDLAPTNGMELVEQAVGPGWIYLSLNASAAYRGQLSRFTRGILFVEPDLFVVHDHLTSKEPMEYRMTLHPPAATLLDTNWGDLRLELPKAGLRINTPGRKNAARSWSRIKSDADSLLPGTVTMQIGPTNRLAQLDVVTVFAVYRGDEKRSFAFKLLESNNAVGAQIHRDGLPTLVAFKTGSEPGDASLTGFQFHGPVGVYVFKPKPNQ